LPAPTKEKVYKICGPEFGHELQGRFAIICRALYGLKSSGAAWQSFFAGTLNDLNFISSLADPDIWMQPPNKPVGTPYYDYIFVYVDDLLVISHSPITILKGINEVYRMKEGSITVPELYLGAQIKQFKPSNQPGEVYWSMSAEHYLKEAIRNLEFDLGRMNKRLPSNVPTPLSSGYRPELDVSAPLDNDFTTWFQKLIGILGWAVELGCIDMHLSVALLAQYLVQPRVGHLDQTFHKFAYLKSYLRSRIVLDASKPTVDERFFTNMDWQDFYPEAKEALPLNAPEPQGNDVLLSCFVDANHAGNKVTQCSHTGIILFYNRAPTVWFSKHQNTVKTSTFVPESIAARIAV